MLVRFRTSRRRRAQAVSELRRLENRTVVGHERGIGERRGSIERDRDGPLIDREDVREIRRVDAAGVRRRAVPPGEDDIFGRAGRSVGPDHALPKSPGNPGPIGRDAAVGESRNLVGQNRDQFPVGVVLGQRLDDQRRPFGFLGAARKVRVEDRRRLPIAERRRPALAGLIQEIAGADQDRKPVGDHSLGKTHLSPLRLSGGIEGVVVE